MAIRLALRNILEIVGRLSHAEVYDYLNELESLGLVKMLQPISDTKEKGGETFRLLNITKEGLEELQPEN